MGKPMALLLAANATGDDGAFARDLADVVRRADRRGGGRASRRWCAATGFGRRAIVIDVGINRVPTAGRQSIA